MQKRPFLSSDEESNEDCDLIIDATSEVVVETTPQLEPMKPNPT